MTSFWAELQRRNVFRVALFYVVASWVILQVAELLFDILDLPTSGLQAVLAILIIGFPVALIVSWVFEITPDGITRESSVKRGETITAASGRRLNIATMALIVVGISVLLADRFLWTTSEPSVPAEEIADDIDTIVAVLPFKAIGSEDGGFLAGGLHDDLLTRLAKLEAFGVISRTSVMEYADTTKNMRQIGKELNARYILEGGVQAMGSRVRVNAQLIDTDTDDHIWADTYDHELTATDIFEIQASLATAIATGIKSNLSESDRQLIGVVPTTNIEAYNAYLRGLEQRDRGGHIAANSAPSLAAFEEAVKADPGFAEAWAHLSIELSRSGQTARSDGNAVMRQAALNALQRARELQPDLHEVDLAQAVFLYRVEYKFAEALQALESLGERRSLAASEWMLRAYILRRLGRWDEAYKSALRSRRLDPRSYSTATNMIGLAWQSEHCDEAAAHAKAGLALAPDLAAMVTEVALYELQCTGNAERANSLLTGVDLVGHFQLNIAMDAALAARDYQRILELSHHDLHDLFPYLSVFSLLDRADALRYLSRHSDAEAVLEEVEEALAHVKLETDGVWLFAAAKSRYFAMIGEIDEFRVWLAEARKRRVEQTGDDRSIYAYSLLQVAKSFAIAGLQDEAIAELRTMVQTPGADRMTHVDLLPEFDALRSHPDYLALLEIDPP